MIALYPGFLCQIATISLGWCCSTSCVCFCSGIWQEFAEAWEVFVLRGPCRAEAFDATGRFLRIFRRVAHHAGGRIPSNCVIFPCLRELADRPLWPCKVISLLPFFGTLALLAAPSLLLEAGRRWFQRYQQKSRFCLPCKACLPLRHHSPNASGEVSWPLLLLLQSCRCYRLYWSRLTAVACQRSNKQDARLRPLLGSEFDGC